MFLAVSKWVVWFLVGGVWLRAYSDPQPILAAESWEGVYSVRLSCQGAREPVCQQIASQVDSGSVTLTRRGIYLQLLKAGADWPFYGFKVVFDALARQATGTTADASLGVEVWLERDPESGILSGWIRDTRVVNDIKVVGTPIKPTGKRTLERLYARNLVGPALHVSEVVGEYSGSVQGDAGRLLLKDSALSSEPTLQGASFTNEKSMNIYVFSELTLDPARGLILLVQYDGGLPLRKWVLAYRREDIDFNPWLLGVGMHLRNISAFDVTFEKRSPIQ